MMLKSFLGVSLLSVALGTTDVVNIVKYHDGACPETCPKEGATTTVASMISCAETLYAPGWEGCSFSGTVAWTGNRMANVCSRTPSGSSTTFVNLILSDLNVPPLMAAGQFQAGKFVTLSFQNPSTKACKWWSLPILDTPSSAAESCDLDASHFDAAATPLLEAPVGSSSIAVPIEAASRLDALGLAADGGIIECGSIQTVDYDALTWEFVATGAKAQNSGGAPTSALAGLAAALYLTVVYSI
eukprot:Gregarina_sp_Pseudo_9__1447@NODE_1971_length_1225_cov_167_371838_g1825_i0_p1_GENE_NODE_1971_length_1225_cov_167_371838_g1825_i0NODE_1971_length_1225_cov_167_371838_g1825_i0_p1_ORF_typecomplete_len243_score61_82_NODE_1971_length_1225_cov_167_371838_g1825_i0216944